MAPANCRTCCVLLAPAVQRVQAEKQLGGRGWTTQAAESPLQAMAELCLLERGRDSRRAWGHDGPEAAEALALVVVDPRSWPDLERLVRAARRHLPAASVWELRNGDVSPLGGPAEVIRPPAAPRAPAASPAPPAPAAAEAAADLNLPPQISPEEIAMLLEGDLHEGSQ